MKWSSLLVALTLLAAKHCAAQINLDSLNAANAKAVSTLPEFIQKAYISKEDSTIWLVADMKKDHRFFGYEKPDRNSRKLLLFSIYTNDVEDNPFKLPYGSYYQTPGMQGRKLKYTGKSGEFLKARYLDTNGQTLLTELYFEKKWFEFD